MPNRAKRFIYKIATNTYIYTICTTATLLGYEQMVSDKFLYSCTYSYTLHVMKYLDIQKHLLYFHPSLIKFSISVSFFPLCSIKIEENEKTVAEFAI